MPTPATDTTPYARELKVAEAAAREAGAFIRSQLGEIGHAAIRDKGVHDLVTYVDIEAERIIREQLLDEFAGDVILGEESAPEVIPHQVDGRRWIVDPLDGTTNFIHGVPPYAVSIALQADADLALGIVYDIPHDELFAAELGQGLTLNGETAHVSETTTLGESLIATGFPFRDFGYAEGYIETLSDFMRLARGIRRHGSAGVDLAWVACGRFDGFFEAGLAPWDMAAGVVLVQAAGGSVSGIPESSNAVFDGGIVACNGHLHHEMARAAEPLALAYGEANGNRIPSSTNRHDETSA